MVRSHVLVFALFGWPNRVGVDSVEQKLVKGRRQSVEERCASSRLMSLRFHTYTGGSLHPPEFLVHGCAAAQTCIERRSEDKTNGCHHVQGLLVRLE